MQHMSNSSYSYSLPVLPMSQYHSNSMHLAIGSQAFSSTYVGKYLANCRCIFVKVSQYRFLQATCKLHACSNVNYLPTHITLRAPSHGISRYPWPGFARCAENCLPRARACSCPAGLDCPFVGCLWPASGSSSRFVQKPAAGHPGQRLGISCLLVPETTDALCLAKWWPAAQV